MQICNNTPHKDKDSNNIACHGNNESQTVELFIKWSLDIIRYLGSHKHLSVLRLIANGKDTTHTMAFHNLCTTHHMIGRESCISIKLSLIYSLMTYRLTRKR